MEDLCPMNGPDKRTRTNPWLVLISRGETAEEPAEPGVGCSVPHAVARRLATLRRSSVSLECKSKRDAVWWPIGIYLFVRSVWLEFLKERSPPFRGGSIAAQPSGNLTGTLML